MFLNLKNMELVTPAIGLIFWTTIVFSLLVLLLKKFAWKPILTAVQNRNESIKKALTDPNLLGLIPKINIKEEIMVTLPENIKKHVMRKKKL